jgi:DNA polymerase-3 subunit alpha
MENLFRYLEENKIRYHQLSKSIIEIDSKKYKLIKPNSKGKLFDDEFDLIVDDETGDFENYVFEFGGKWYYTPKGSEGDPELNILKYIGIVNHEFVDTQFPFLGVRGKYEMLNGSRLYTDWVKKAKFLGVSILGICEKNSLAGVLSFQLVCEKSKIQSIIGATYTVNQNDYRYDIKLYVENEVGWKNILLINKEVNVINPKYILEKDLVKYLEGLIVVFDPKSIVFEKLPNIDGYYQFDTVEYENDTRDKEYLLNLKKFVGQSKLKPILITDAFYLDKEDSEIKVKLNQISGIREHKALNQYFKDVEDTYREVESLWRDESLLFHFLGCAIENLWDVANRCEFKIDTSKRHLPEYELSEEESKKYTDKYDLFWGLIEEGLKKRVHEGRWGEYLERVEYEFNVIEKGEVIDYFLLTHDIVSWARKQGILVGIGRGSGGGSLISYLLFLTHLDPIKLGLLFERFLNEGRVKVSLPDLDIDFSASRREEVKRYMQERFGVNQVCSIGTYTTLQVRAAFREFCRLENVPPEEINYLSKLLDNLEDGTGSITDLFKMAVKNSRLKAFIKDHPDVINLIDLVLGQPKAASVHACATLILPKEKDIYSWIPVKMVEFGKDNQNILVSEWEGEELETAGFLKEDILGIQQLDKFQTIVQLIKEQTGEFIDIYSIPLDDPDVYDRFKKGLNADVFHFGAFGLTQYCKELKPDNLEDLIVGISLYRPGPIESGFHKKYVELKEGREEPVYDYGLEEVTKETYGLYVYQEQIMQVYRILGGFTLVEADDIRKAMGKIKQELIDSYDKQFVEGAIKRGCPPDVAEEIKKKMKGFGQYSFNRSHAAAYAITGYIAQWFKVHYPIYFWTTAFKYLDEDWKTSRFMSEIYKLGDIVVAPPDINLSGFDSNVNYEKRVIYWKLSAIKQCGEKATEQIVALRRDGDYFSFEEFLHRNIFTGSKVNKLVVENLILGGVFDEIESIRDVRRRIDLVDKYRTLYKVKPAKDDFFIVNSDKLEYMWWWFLQQKKLSGLGFFDFHLLCNEFLDDVDFKYVDEVNFFNEDFDKVDAKIGGFIVEVVEKDGRKGKYADVVLEVNYETIEVKFWSAEWELFKDIVLGSEKSLMVCSGTIGYDNWKKNNVLYINGDSVVRILD